MARNIYLEQRKMITHVICSKSRLTTSQMGKIAQYNERSITRIRKNLGVQVGVGPSELLYGLPEFPVRVSDVELITVKRLDRNGRGYTCPLEKRGRRATFGILGSELGQSNTCSPFL